MRQRRKIAKKLKAHLNKRLGAFSDLGASGCSYIINKSKFIYDSNYSAVIMYQQNKRCQYNPQENIIKKFKPKTIYHPGFYIAKKEHESDFVLSHYLTRKGSVNVE